MSLSRFGIPAWVGIFCLMITSLMPQLVFGQEDGKPVVIGRWQSIESKVLDETRRLIISLPDNYEESQKKYPVVYLLDGPGHFHHTTGLIDFLSSNGVTPEMIVVAVANTNRTRDMTPLSQAPNPGLPSGGGGAEKFIQFFADELIPHIEKSYRTHDYKILIGHSFGGLFTVHTLVHRPDLFDAYIAISPSLQWDEQRLVSQAEEFFEKSESLNKTLYMTSGNEGMALTGGVLKLAGVLTEHAPKGFEWDKRIMREETHGSVVHRSTRQGLEFVFKDWLLRDQISEFDERGIKGILEHFTRSQERYGLAPEAPDLVILRLGLALCRRGRLEEARSVLEFDLENFPPNPMVYMRLAQKYQAKQNREQAIDCYSRAFSLNPADKQAKEKLIELGVDLKAFEDAMFQVSTEVLKKYAGIYDNSTGSGKVTVEFADGKLKISGVGVPTVELMPKSKHCFVADGQFPQFVFGVDDDGKVDAFLVKLGNSVMTELQRKD